MKPQLESIARTLKAARESKGLSQLALGKNVGLPQSHISKIENAAVDLQTSSLIEIARALDLELTLLPRSALSAIQALQPRRSLDVARGLTDRPLIRLTKKARTLQHRFPQAKVFERLIDTAEGLRRVRFGALAASQIQGLIEQISDSLDELRRQDHKTPKIQTKALLEKLASHTDKLRQLRNVLVHGHVERPSTSIPAYRLDSDGKDHG